MKKYFAYLAIFSAVFFVTACSSSKKNTELKAERSTLKGNWEITNVEVNLPSGYKVTEAFGTAPYEDFKNSQWNLIQNGKGSFSLTDGTTQKIYWSWTKGGLEGQLTFKKLEDGQKPKDVLSGYVLDLYDLTKNSFQAVANVEVEPTKTGTITYTFERR